MTLTGRSTSESARRSRTIAGVWTTAAFILGGFSMRVHWKLILPALFVVAPLSAQTIEVLDIWQQPATVVYEFGPFQIKATDAGSAGLGTLEVEIRSDLRGDVESRNLTEDSTTPGVFWGYATA